MPEGRGLMSRYVTVSATWFDLNLHRSMPFPLDGVGLFVAMKSACYICHPKHIVQKQYKLSIKDVDTILLSGLWPLFAHGSEGAICG